MPNRTCSVEGCDKPHHSKSRCAMHHERWKRTGTTADPGPRQSSEERFWAKVDRSGGPDACWPWTASLATFGYGQFNNGKTMVSAHGFAYRLLVGAVPAGLELDHVCHDALVCTLGSRCPHRRCVNPAHMKPSTHAENTRRNHNGVKTHCVNGHPFAGANLVIGINGGRRCRTCLREWNRQARLRKRSA